MLFINGIFQAAHIRDQAVIRQVETANMPEYRFTAAPLRNLKSIDRTVQTIINSSQRQDS
jgi:hypothetical protein